MTERRDIEFMAFFNESEPNGRPVDVSGLPRMELRAASSDRLNDLASTVLRQHEPEIRKYFDATPDFVYRELLTVADADGRRGVAPHAPAVVAEDGGLKWREDLEGVTIGDLERAREAGLFVGDPHALLVELPLGGNGVFDVKTWAQFLEWLVMLGGVAAGAEALRRAGQWLFEFIKRHHGDWEKRGASTSYAFLDVVLVRRSWSVDELATLLQVEKAEARDLLRSLGFEHDSQTGHFRASKDPEKGYLRERIVQDFLDGDPAESRRQYLDHLKAQGINVEAEEDKPPP